MSYVKELESVAEGILESLNHALCDKTKLAIFANRIIDVKDMMKRDVAPCTSANRFRDRLINIQQDVDAVIHDVGNCNETRAKGHGDNLHEVKNLLRKVRDDIARSFEPVFYVIRKGKSGGLHVDENKHTESEAKKLDGYVGVVK